MTDNKLLRKVIGKMFPILSIIVFFAMVGVIFNTFDLTLDVALYNVILAVPVFGIFLMISRRYHVAVILGACLFFFIYYIDLFVFASRLTHIRYTDFRLIGDAARIANRYHFVWNVEVTRKLLIAVALCALLLFIYKYYKLEYKKKKAFFTGLGITVVSLTVIISGLIPSSLEGFDFTKDAEDKGLFYSWYCQAEESSMVEPEGYSRAAAEAILNDYRDIKGTTDDVRAIVIMNESLTDYSLLGPTRFEDPLPFIHSLVKNGEAFEGKLAVSVFGGGTANSEFEFLTGHATALLPEGCTPYLQYIDHKINSIVEDVGDVEKIAIHPYYSEEWNRTQVYRFFGFDRFISGVDFGSMIETNGKKATSKLDENIVSFGPGPLYVRGLISDKSCFERIIKEDADFSFSVTIQNHGAYYYSGEDFSNKAYVSEKDRKEWNGKHSLNGMLYDVASESVEQEIFAVNQFLTVVNLSDQAFQELIGELKKVEKKTIVLMFGDHQPGLLISEHYVDCEETTDMDYVVPYILWTNYDAAFDAPEYISPNYLSAVLKKNAGMSLTAWDQFRLKTMEKYPVVTTNYILDREGNAVSKEVLRDYSMVQYMRMFE